MEVSYWSRNPKQNDYQAVELKELFTHSDVIFPAMELNNETKKIITDNLLASMKNSAIFISIVHDMFNQELVLELVKTNKLFGFGFEAEPKIFDNFKGNVWAAPAYGWATDSTMHNSMVKWVDNMVNAVDGKFPNRIN
jgi:lactate dehydrogenase-like 2-hydroxyacid dehydrogenase